MAFAVLGMMMSGCGNDTSDSTVTTQETETRLRAELGVPDGAQRVLILSQSLHLDWDWLLTFDAYFQRSVDGILTDALQLLSQHHGTPTHYFYSVAEIGYLQRFAAVHPELVEPLRQAGQDLRIVGGGITSPDNLLPSGEAFIRDYLVGKTWVDATLGLPIRQAWLPDDFDKQTGTETVASGAAANSLRVYRDDGGLYRFGDEMVGCSLTPQTDAVESPLGDATVMESGPLRVRVAAHIAIGGQMFEKEYQLVAEEPFLRMRSTGAAPDGTSVLVHFPLAGPVDDVAHGTPYHWDHKVPARAGALTFEATHDFLILTLRGEPRAALFHSGVPAWAVQPDGAVLGALWRNAQQEHCDIYGASGTDAAEHTVDYALRVASGITAPQQGQQLREALMFHTPLQTIVAAASGSLPRTFSLAATTDAAFITAAKAGNADPETIVLRVYQPTDTPFNISVRTEAGRRFPPRWQLGVHGCTALESELPAGGVARLALSGSAEQFDFVAARALTTIAISHRSASAGR